MESKRLKKILEENKKYEQESPYNFCDRWCERCEIDKRLRCRVYQDELEREITCIAHGRESDDPEITAEVMKKQCEGIDEQFEELCEENEIELDAIDDPELDKIKAHIAFVQNNPLQATADKYMELIRGFLDETFYRHSQKYPLVRYDFETVAWYHTLLPIKLNRALAGFHEPMADGDIALNDSVAQLFICKKCIRQSLPALGKIKNHFPGYKQIFIQGVALLHNIDSRIGVLIDSIK